MSKNKSADLIRATERYDDVMRRLQQTQAELQADAMRVNELEATVRARDLELDTLKAQMEIRARDLRRATDRVKELETAERSENDQLAAARRDVNRLTAYSHALRDRIRTLVKALHLVGMTDPGAEGEEDIPF